MKSNRKESIAADFLSVCQAKTCPVTGLKLRSPATLTNVRMKSTFNAVERIAGKRWGKNFSPENMTFNQLWTYAQDRMGKVSVRSVQNEMSHFRKAFRACGRKKFADEVTNKSLGLPRTSRIGKGVVIPEEVIAEAKKKAKASTVVWIDLLSLGLRIRELVRCGESLIRWKNRLARGMKIDVLDGTKGGRPRVVFIPPERRAAALAAITAGIELIGLQGRLVVSKNLRAAVSQVSQRFARVGLEGIYSAHSFRRRFALMNYQFYLALKKSSKFALKMTCEDLGHGDKRGQWVYNSYVRATLEGNKDLHHLLVDRRTRAKREGM